MSLESWRTEIDAIDTEILGLLQKRIAIFREIGKVKARAGLPLIDEEREEVILNRVLRRREEPLSVEAVTCVFNCVIRESRRVQIEESSAHQREFIDEKSGDTGHSRFLQRRSGTRIFGRKS